MREQRQRDIRRFFHTMFSRRIVIIGAVGTAFFLLIALIAAVAILAALRGRLEGEQ